VGVVVVVVVVVVVGVLHQSYRTISHVFN